MMKFEAVTLKDIAKALRLSTSTVSRALHDSYEISEDTKKIVLDYAKQINYRPNPIALSLKEKRSRSIGIVVSEIANSFFSQAINGIESVAHAKGYNAIISQSYESYEKEISSLQFLASRSVDGCLISVTTETNDTSHILDLHNKGMHFVSFDRIVEGLPSHKVYCDNFQGSYNAIIHLLKNGYRRIAFLSNSSQLSISKERLAGYKKAMDDFHIPYDENLFRQCTHGGMIYEEVENAMKELFKMKKKPDAIFSSSDKITISCLRYCKQKRLKIPKDLAIIGFSNMEITDLLNPSLSVIKQPAFEIGKTAAELLIKMIESKRQVTDFQDIKLAPQLIIRESSAAKKNI